MNIIFTRIISSLLAICLVAESTSATALSPFGTWDRIPDQNQPLQITAQALSPQEGAARYIPDTMNLHSFQRTYAELIATKGMPPIAESKNNENDPANKSLARISPANVNEALSEVIRGGDAVALDLTQSFGYYMDPHLSVKEQATRYQAAFLGEISTQGRNRLIQHLSDPQTVSSLWKGLILLSRVIDTSHHRSTIRGRRFVIVLGDQPDFVTTEILAHAGSQVTSREMGIPSIFIPLDLLLFVHENQTHHVQNLGFVIEHEDFHLRGNLVAGQPGIRANEHDYSSEGEYLGTELLWGSYRDHRVQELMQPAKNLTLKEAMKRLWLLIQMKLVNQVSHDLSLDNKGQTASLTTKVAGSSAKEIVASFLQLLRSIRDMDPRQRYDVKVVDESRPMEKRIRTIVNTPHGPRIVTRIGLIPPRHPGTNIVAARINIHEHPGSTTMSFFGTSEDLWDIIRHQPFLFLATVVAGVFLARFDASAVIWILGFSGLALLDHHSTLFMRRSERSA